MIDQLLEPLGNCFTPEVAKRIVNLRADNALQTRVDYLAHRANQGTLSEAERSEYEQYVTYSQFVTLLQIKARKILNEEPEG